MVKIISKRFRVCIGLLMLNGLWLAIPVQASTAEQQLQDFFDDMRTLTAQFDQQVKDADGALIQHSQGQLWLQRPGRFRWDYVLPYRQLIVGDGKQVWIYDEDLEQVTVRAFDASMGQTPALLLSSDKPIMESFRVMALGERDGIVWLQLLPRGSDAVFEELRLGLLDGQLRYMELRDGLGHITLLSFTAVKRNHKIDPQYFIFVPPAGVDVMRDDGQGFGQHTE